MLHMHSSLTNLISKKMPMTVMQPVGQRDNTWTWTVPNNSNIKGETKLLNVNATMSGDEHQMRIENWFPLFAAKLYYVYPFGASRYVAFWQRNTEYHSNNQSVCKYTNAQSALFSFLFILIISHNTQCTKNIVKLFRHCIYRHYRLLGDYPKMFDNRFVVASCGGRAECKIKAKTILLNSVCINSGLEKLYMHDIYCCWLSWRNNI